MTNLPSYILSVFAIFSPIFSKPTHQKGLLLLVAHILCRGNRTITNCLRQLGLKNVKNYSSYHDFFRLASWSSIKASKILLFAIRKQWLSCGKSINIILDTTIERRRGPHIYGLGIHRDAVRSTQNQKVLTPGHNWLVVCILIRFPGTKVLWALPFLSILLKPEKKLSSSQCDVNYRHKKMTKYVEQIIHLLRRWLGPQQHITLTADSAFCCRSICVACLKRKIVFCSQLRLDASLHDFPPPRKGKGRPRVVGKRLPSLQEIASDPHCKWESLLVSWYNGEMKLLEICTGTALWYHSSNKNAIPIRWVLTRNPEKEVIALMCTDLQLEGRKIIERFIERWPIESTFQALREDLGFETVRTWAKKGVERVSPSIIASYSIICLIAARAADEKKEEITPLICAWYEKNHVTFSDVHAYVKLLTVNAFIFPQSAKKQTVGKKELVELLYRWVIG